MAMKYVSAYLMVVLSGNDKPSKKDVEGTLSSVGIDVEGEVMDAFFEAVAGKNPQELIAEGMTKLQSVNVGGSAGTAPAAAGVAAPVAAQDDKSAAKHDEKQEEEEEEDDMGFSLFD